MPVAHPRKSAFRVLCAGLLAVAWLGLPCPVTAFVILDTSGPGSGNASDSTRPSGPGSSPADRIPDPAGPPAGEAGPGDSLRAPSASRRAPDHFGTVLFLSADSKLVYAYVGVLKALEEFGLQPDAVLAESKAVLVGAAWSLGYSAAQMERDLLRSPVEGYLRPLRVRAGKPGETFSPAGPDPMQWEIPLGLQSLQSPASRWSEVTMGEGGEYLHLSWMVARLTHDAPGGQVENLEAAPRRLAVQVADLATEESKVLVEGGLQDIIKGSLLPSDVIRSRRRLWPYASGALLSGHAVMSDKLPFACDRIILVRPGRRLRPSALDERTVPWTDSLVLGARRRAPTAAAAQGAVPRDGNGGILRIELEPDGDFDPAEPDPARWIELGYTSALRSMDVLKSVLGGPGEPQAPAPGAPGEGPSAAEERLGLNRLSVNPLASGGRELLLDIVRISERDRADSTGEGAIAALVRSGFYSDLDVEWARGTDQDKAMLVFDAKEKSDILFRAGWNATFTGESLPDRPPELYGGLSWSEPFYIPFRAEAGFLLGGHQPGYEVRAMIAPVYPLRLELGVSRTYWEIQFPYSAPKAAMELGAEPVQVSRGLSEVFLKVFPLPSLSLGTAIQRHELDIPGLSDPAGGHFQSTDFQETALLGIGAPETPGPYRHSLRLRYRNHNRVNLMGTVKNSIYAFESLLRVGLGDFRFTDRYFWSDQSNQDLTIFDLVEAGRMDIFTFQDEYLLKFLRSANFQEAKIEYGPTFGRAGLRLIAGAYRNYGPALFAEQLRRPSLWGMDIPLQGFWEAQAGYATPLGSLRAGMGGLEGGAPFFFLRLGAGLALGFSESE